MDQPEQHLKSTTLQKRLGEFLLSEGHISPDQLDEAIEYQCIYGGKLGTSLVELGLIEEEYLAQVLSQKLRLHYIKPHLLMNVAPEILKLVPRKLALKYRVVPYHEESKKLYLAMADTTNLADIDELSFQLDHIIVPLAIPELRLMLALKKHYAMTLTPRFETLDAQYKRDTLSFAKSPDEAAAQSSSTEDQAWPLLGEEDYEGEEPTDDAYFDFSTPSTELSYTSLSQQLTNAKDREDIAKALVNYLAQEFSGCGLFMVRAPFVTGWLAACRGSMISGFDRFQASLQEHTALNVVIQSKTHYLGTMTDTPKNRELLNYYALAPPQSILIMPLLVRERLVSILYIQDDSNKLEERFTELQNIARKAEMSFTLLILKNKILAT